MKPMLVFAFLSLWSALPGYEAKMRVVDDAGTPVQGAGVAIEFVAPRPEHSVIYRSVTGPDGHFYAKGQSLLEVYMEAKKPGYHTARVNGLSPKRDHDQLIVLPRILNPVPLFANRAELRVPAPQIWLGYDFEAADWVRPYGQGTVADIRFRFRHEFKGWKFNEKELSHGRKVNSGLSDFEFKSIYGKWDAELEISFPGEKEGILEETRFLAYSKLKLPHAAPVDGYLPKWRYTSNTYTPPTTRENVGFFLRTRVKLDEKGDILSANYAKVVGDIACAATGLLRFTYYFNPVPNDRNLEFDPKRNLLPANLPGTNVSDP